MSAPVEILIVDDNRDDVDIALRAIRRENLDVHVSVARDGGEALAMLGIEQAGAGPPVVAPQVIFLDLKMPRVDGWEVLRRLREHPSTQTLPVVVLSWSSQGHDVDRCYTLGANSFLVKRFDPSRPGAYFAEAVRYWAKLNQAPRAAGPPKG
jgi:CheY-like chemotaxis protein